VETRTMVRLLRHRQTKGAETDMPGLPPRRHIPTLPPKAVIGHGRWHNDTMSDKTQCEHNESV